MSMTKSLHTVTSTVNVARFLIGATNLASDGASFAVLAADKSDRVGTDKDRLARQYVRRALSILGYEPAAYGWQDPTIDRIARQVGNLLGGGK
jgi:hypothetical protein